MTETELIIAGYAALGVSAVLLLWQCLRYWRRAENRGAELAVQNERLRAREQEAQRLAEALHESQSENRSLYGDLTRLRENITRLESDLGHERTQFEEKLKLLTDSRERMTLEFKNLANEILEDKSRRFTDSNRSNIAEILKPLQEKIHLFEKRVEETYDKESKERFSLAREIQALQELNHRLSEDAVNLANALKGDNKAQGTWGEIVLEKILERSGLTRGREYETQVSLKAEDGSRGQPDVIVHLPESKDIVIDAKVSLKAYEAWCSEENPERRTELLNQHVQSVRAHIKLLSSKDYQKLSGVNTLDFVLLFLPVEAAFSAAVQHDHELFASAFEKNILLVGPSTLLATLRIVENIWRLAHQNENADEIARQAGQLHDKFVGFLGDLEEVGKKISSAYDSYENAQKKLQTGRGNLLNRVDNLRQLGARTAKTIDPALLAGGKAGELDEIDDAGESGADGAASVVGGEESANDPSVENEA